MQRSTSTLVLVAHPGDETLAFSTLCAGADVVSLTEGSWPGFAEEFRGACDRLGAKRAFSLSLPNIDPWRLPNEVIVDRLKALGPYSRIYTHSPLEQHSHHRDVAFAASQCFEEIWVRACRGYAAEAYVLSQSAFGEKLKIINQMYAQIVHVIQPDDCLGRAASLAYDVRFALLPVFLVLTTLLGYWAVLNLVDRRQLIMGWWGV